MKKEEPKQETLEEASIRLVPNRTLKTPFGSPYEITPTRERNTFKKGAKWQQEQDKKLYSEEEVLTHLNNLIKMPSSELDKFTNDTGLVTMKWFEQFKTNQSTK
jgi:hypothetical protein